MINTIAQLYRELKDIEESKIAISKEFDSGEKTRFSEAVEYVGEWLADIEQGNAIQERNKRRGISL